MPTILTTQDQIPGADMADLLATYAHYAGRAVNRFSSRAVAERRTLDALMTSADARGHLGVPKHTQPAPTGHAELVAKAAETGRADPTEMAKEGLPGSTAGVETDSKANPYPPGSLAARLWAQAEGAPVPPPVATAQAAQTEGKPRAAPAMATGWVKVAPGTPTARLNKSSERCAVYDYIVAANGPCGVAALIERWPGAKGHLGKLRATNHIVDCDAPGDAQ